MPDFQLPPAFGTKTPGANSQTQAGGGTDALTQALRGSTYDQGKALVTPTGQPSAAQTGPGATGGEVGGKKLKSALAQKVYDGNTKRVEGMEPARSEEQSADDKLFEANWTRNQARYDAVSAKTGIPARLIAALHWRESSGNFETYLHQGDPLGKPAVHEPTDIPIFYKWEDAAVHALQQKKGVQTDLGMTAETTDKAAMATYSEYYNGLGYHLKGQPSPYVFAGTNQYKSGKYVADGKYDPQAKDRQNGVMSLIGSDPNKTAQG